MKKIFGYGKKSVSDRDSRKQRVIIAIIVSVLLSFAICTTGNAFPRGGSGKAPQTETGQTTQPAQQPQPSQEELEKMKKGMEEAKKIVVAKVNGANITMAIVVMLMNRIASNRQLTPSMPPEEVAKINKEALSKLILQELAYQKAKAEGLKVETKNIDEAISNFKANAGAEEEYKKFLEAQQVTEEELRAQIERSLLLQRIFAKEVYGKVVVPEAEVRKEYEKLKDRYIKPEKIVVIDVIFLIKTDSEDSIKKTKEVLKKINDDKDKDPWKLILDGTFIVRDFEIPKDKDKELSEEAKKLKVGELSGVIKTSDSFHIIKLKEYSPEKQLTFEEVRGSLEGKFRAAAQQKRLEEWGEELKKEAKIEIIETESSKQKTEDKESAQKPEDKEKIKDTEDKKQ
ncbi:MAG: peptidyl-prolyl cis-trans isomerase [Nitrospirae bacterium]|nr:peptidyl-prolyl cis-trans isomerase [Nitrospirota bacterium]